MEKIDLRELFDKFQEFQMKYEFVDCFYIIFESDSTGMCVHK